MVFKEYSDCSGNRKAEIIIPPALALLGRERRWVVWQWVTRDGKATKPPFRADAPGFSARTNDPATWCDLETALRAFSRTGMAGVGFVLTNSGFAAFDIDDCRDPSTGEIHPWALDKVNRSRTYAEVTPSKTGLRIIGLTNSGEQLNKRFTTVPGADGVACELYRKATRYITLTGEQIGDAAELQNIDALLDEVFLELGGVKRENKKSSTYDDDRIVDIAEVRQVVRFIPEFERETRIKVGIAIHNATSGKGFAVWKEYLERCGKWNDDAQRSWDGFAGKNYPITMGSLIYWADQGNPDWRNILDREFVEMQSRKAMQLTEEELANLLQDN